MSTMLDFELGSEALERSKVDLVVAGFFSDQHPLRGGAGRVDWRLCGLVSEQILAGRIAGAPGDAIMIPSSGQLRANNVLLVGLGPRAPYRLGEVADAVSDVIARAIRLACPSLAMTPLGLAEDEFPRCAEAFVAGAAAGFAQSQTSLRLRVILPPAQINRAAQSIDAAIADLGPECFRFKRPSLADQSMRLSPHAPALPKLTTR